MLASQEIKNLVIAMGASIGDTFNLEKMRYHKIVIATDADVDGSHIRTLLLTLFYRYFRPIIDAGYLYIAQPPLYKIKKGKEVSYAFTEEEKEKIIGKDAPDLNEIEEAEGPEELEGSEENENDKSVDTEDIVSKGKKSNKVHIQRYKGLGEMNADELWETTMRRDTRTIKQVNVKDGQEADRVFETLMGSEVGPRKSFIQSHAKIAEIDI